MLDPVIELFPIVRVRTAPPAMDGEVNEHDPCRPLQVTLPEAAPDPVATGRTSPLPAVEATKFPLVAVTLPRVAVRVVADVILPAVVVILPAVATILPVVAVIPVPAVIVVPADRVVPAASVVVVVNDPGAVIAEGRESVTTPEVVDAVISLAVPSTAKTVPELPMN